MARPTLTRRSNQLALVADACERGRPARLAIRTRRPDAPSGNTRLLALEHDGLYVAWPDVALRESEQAGAAAELFFEVGGRSYTLVSRTLGCCDREFGAHGRITALKLNPPLRVESTQRRRDVRVPLNQIKPVFARLTGSLDETVRLTLRLTNLSRGGAAGVTDAPAARRVDVGDLFWMVFCLPGRRRPFEFVVRLAHTGKSDDPFGTLLGMNFCPGDEPGTYETNLARLARFVEHIAVKGDTASEGGPR